MTEAKLQKAVLDRARILGWRIARFPAANWQTRGDRAFIARLPYQTKGFPDALLVRDRVLFVEFKDAKGKLSVDQRDWADSLLYAGAEHHVWRPADLDSGVIDEALKRNVAAAA